MLDRYNGFCLPNRRSELTDAELEWMVVLRSMFPAGVPAPRAGWTSRLWKVWLVETGRYREESK